MAGDDLERHAAELYALRPDRFTAARDERARQVRAGGDRGLATEIRRLRRPTLSAWAVNLLLRERPDRLDGLLELGERLRDAQRGLRGDQLRSLSQRRGEAITELAGEIRRLADAAGQRLSETAGDEVRATLEAAVADPEAASAVRSGRLVKPLSYSGFGGVDLADVVPIPPGRSGTAARRRTAAAGRAGTEPAEAKRRRLQQAERDAEAAGEAEAAARARHDEAQQRAAALRAELDRAKQDAADAGHQLREASRRYERARREVAARRDRD